ncbi:MAG: ECF transporter S component [Oscillospiraceae bacterium]|nr:ECF transporter S component [Oscillospiraceae bacterium]
MNKTIRRSAHTRRLVLLALLSAIVAVLAYYGGFIKIGGLASISLTLIPVVIGATLCGPLAGAWLGGVAGAVFLATPDAAFWLSLSIPGTIITVMVKGILSGLCAGLVYKPFKRFNSYFAVVVSAVVCPVVNTGIFLLGSLVFFMDTVSGGAAAEGISVGKYLIIFFVGLNFVFELIANVALSPAMVRILNVARKEKD